MSCTKIGQTKGVAGFGIDGFSIRERVIAMNPLFAPFSVIFRYGWLILLLCGCQTMTVSDPLVSNADTPVQKLEVTVGSHLDLRLPAPAIGRWWKVESGARPWLIPRSEVGTGRIRLKAVKVGSTRVTCILRDRNSFEYRKVVVDVEVKPVQ